MSGIIRVHRKSKNYTVVSNVPFLDIRLSFGARGILAYLLTKPDHWEVRSEDLIAESPHGRHAILGMLKELEECGYLVRNRVRGEKGLWAWETEVFESPRKVDSAPKSGFPTTDNPTHDNPTCDNPTSYKGSKELNEESVLREERARAESPEDEHGGAPVPQDDTLAFSESEPFRRQDSRRPIDADGGEDERYETPQFAAVLEVCGLRDDLLKLDPRSRAATAMYAAGLAETYTADQILASRKTWPFDSPPHPKQLLQHLPKFIITQEKANAAPDTPVIRADGSADVGALRAARRARAHGSAPEADSGVLQHTGPS